MTDFGGSAFPVIVTRDTNQAESDSGMSMLDWFAGQALAGYLANQCVGNPDQRIAWSDFATDVAEACYDYATAMISERAKRIDKSDKS